MTVRNDGQDRTFYAQCEIEDRRPQSKATRRDFTFNIVWLHHHRSRELRLAHEESQTLRLGYMLTAADQTLVDFSEWSNGGISNFSREYIRAQDEVEWDLLITVFQADNGNYKNAFTLVKHADGTFSVTQRGV